jgi:hypothetical protein
MRRLGTQRIAADSRPKGGGTGLSACEAGEGDSSKAGSGSGEHFAASEKGHGLFLIEIEQFVGVEQGMGECSPGLIRGAELF